MNEALRKAADLIEANGWWQSKSDSDCGNNQHICVAMAIDMAITADRASGKKTVPFNDAKEQLERHLGVTDVIAWNDTPGRTKDEVIAALRAAAELP